MLNKILFENRYGNRKKPLFESQSRLAELLYNSNSEKFASELSVKTYLNQILLGNKSLSKNLKFAILEIIEKEFADEKETYQTIENEFLQALEKLNKDIEETKKKKTLNVGAGYFLFSSPIALMMKSLIDKNQENIKITTYGQSEYRTKYDPIFNSTKAPNIYIPKIGNGVHKDDLVVYHKPWDAIDLLNMLSENKIELACIAGDVYEEQKERYKTLKTIKCGNITLPGQNGIQILISTKNKELKKILAPIEKSNCDNHDEIVRKISTDLFEKITEIYGDRDIPLLYINNTLSEIESDYIAKKSKNIKLVKTYLADWHSLKNTALTELNNDETFLYTGWYPHIEWLRNKDDTDIIKKDYTVINFDIKNIVKNRKNDFSFDLIANVDKLSTHKELIFQFVDLLEKMITEISKDSFDRKIEFSFLDEYFKIKNPAILKKALSEINFSFAYSIEFVNLLFKGK